MAIPQKVKPIIDIRGSISELSAASTQADARLEQDIVTLGAVSAAADKALSQSLSQASEDLDDYKIEDQVFVSSSCPTDEQGVTAEDFALNNVWLDTSNMETATVAQS